MHYYALAIVPADGDLDELLAETMAPYDENRDVAETVSEYDGEKYWHNPHGLWDWYKVGGRWTGVLSGYDPHEDPALLEACWLCSGTGKRDDELGRTARAANPDYTCNGCDGKGRSRTWPTQWPRHDGDVVDALDVTARLTEIRTPHTIFTHGSESVTCKEIWTGKDFKKIHDEDGMRSVLATILHSRIQAGLKDRVVVVDYHS